MVKKLAKTCSYAVLVLALAIGVVAVATNNSLALAQPCQALLASPNVYGQQYYYYGPNFQVTVPVSATCSFYPGQIYATGTAYDLTYNTNIGTANTVLTPTYSGYASTGQLTFTLPTSAQAHPVQFSVSIYSTPNGYYGGYYGYYPGSLVAQTSSTFVVGSNYYQSYPSNPIYSSYPTPSYPIYSSYPTSSYPTYPTYPSNYYYSSPRYTQNQGGYYYMGGYYNYYHNGGSYNNNNYCSTSNHCTHR